MPKKLKASSKTRATGSFYRQYGESPTFWYGQKLVYEKYRRQSEVASQFLIDTFERTGSIDKTRELTIKKYGHIPVPLVPWSEAESILKEMYYEQRMGKGAITDKKVADRLLKKYADMDYNVEQLTKIAEIFWETYGPEATKSVLMTTRQWQVQAGRELLRGYKSPDPQNIIKNTYQQDDAEAQTTYVGQKVEYSGLTEGKDGWRRVTKRSKISMYYGKGSKVMGSVEGMQAVKLSNRMKGWMTPEGRFVNIDDIRQHLYSVSKTMYGTAQDVTILDIYDSLTPEQQAKAARELMNVDWNQFYEEYINSPVEQGAYVEELSGKAGYEMLLDILMRARE